MGRWLTVGIVCLLGFVGVGIATSLADAAAPFVLETADPGGFVGPFTSLAIDRQGDPHIVYWDVGNQVLNYAVRRNGTWTVEVVEATGFVGEETSIAVDSQGDPHASFHNYTASTEVLRYATRSGGSWSVETVEITADNVGRYNSIEVDSEGEPHISYYNSTQNDLIYAEKVLGVWNIQTANFNTGQYTDLVLDRRDRPHISYVDATTVHHATLRDTWTDENVDVNADVNWTAVAVTSNADPYVAYYTNAAVLSVATQEAGTWVSEVPEPGFVSSGRMSLQIDSQGRLCLAYRLTQAGVGDLKYLVKDTFWQSQVVDPYTGSNVSLALDPYGNPMMAYYDYIDAEARLADSSVYLNSSYAGVTWPVGSQRTITWNGAGAVDIMLSTNGGADWVTLASNVTGGSNVAGGAYEFAVPHSPSRFCKIRVVRPAPYSVAENDSFFTIEADIALLSFVVLPAASGSGNMLSWNTRPGPKDLAGYRVMRRMGDGIWIESMPLSRATSHYDGTGESGDAYRLYAVNGLGTEFLMGEVGGVRPPEHEVLSAWPNPFSTGELSIEFGTSGGIAGADGRVELSIYDAAGRLVRELVHDERAADVYVTSWDGRLQGGALAPAGVYFVRLSTGGEVYRKKIVIVR